MRTRWPRLVGVLLMMAVVSVQAAQAPVSVAAAADRYAAGDSGGIRLLLAERLTAAALTDGLDRWIGQAAPGDQPKRRAVAAAFALETSWTATRHVRNEQSPPADFSNGIQPRDPAKWPITSNVAQAAVAAWIARQLPSTELSRPVEETFWLATSGLAQEGHAWRMLQEDVLAPAAKRFGAHPRLRLANAIARAGRELGSLHLSNAAQRRPGLNRESLPSSVTGKIPETIRAFDALKSEAGLAAEIDLRVGYLELRRGKWTEALARLESARQTATEPVLRAAADYFAGWIHEQQERPAEATVAYRRANAIIPEMRGVATRLATLLYLENNRDEAHRILKVAVDARPAPRDLLITVERGDARFMPDWLKTIREAVR